MNNLKLLTHSDVKNTINKRAGESKFGEHIKLCSNLNSIYDELLNLDVDYVIFGISEDVGVLANHGKPGTSKAWNAVIKILLNIQANAFTKAERVAILGQLHYPAFQEKVNLLNLSRKKDIALSRQLVQDIDKDVSYLVSLIIKSGKTPIIIGGGHNNAYGNIKGTSLGLSKPINCINFDAHSDFRKEEGRHSGNGFSYAYAEGFLKKYYVFGLHENYTSQFIFDRMNKLKTIDYCTYESLDVRKDQKYKSALKHALNHVDSDPFGIEIDCDAIENIQSSALTPSGFSAEKARQFVHYFGMQPNASYLHICEAAPKKKQEVKIGKLITYLITDFIRAHDR
ncbi:formimidoylglutamase [Ichthyenterobacterium sp. W332]|uniref:Formimidoylglutamase n=1 Tax=Microcosmobacter mediterraneus TaxID=3075607 RepID=A0ABU2YKU7_9FLAO|nr:formimidoylglutamase [Ichthyenterobacterium sp. W332]MDT0558789.1 formimidoylglutamase [Ichthyenterobacterium sp. W332]